MRFQVGDLVVHPVYGVGTVETYTEQRFSGEKTRHYYKVTTSGPTIWVPLDEQGETVLREVASKDALRECRRLLSSAPVRLDKNRQLRQVEIARCLKDGSIRSLCEIVRDLTAEQANRPLGMSDDRLLRKMTKSLADEWAAAEGVTPLIAAREIEELLQAGHARS